MKAYICEITGLKAHLLSEANGDEVFIKYGGKKVWPTNKQYERINKAGELPNIVKIQLGQVGSPVQLELWEYDNFLFKTLLGTFMLPADTPGGPFTTDMKVDGGTTARYSIVWKLSEVREKVNGK